MSRPPSHSKAKLLLIALAASATIALKPPAPLGLHINVGGDRGGRAELHIGSASIRIAVGSGQRCSNSDSCATPTEFGVPGTELARGLLKL